MKFQYKYSYRKSDVLRPHIFSLPKSGPLYFMHGEYNAVIDAMVPWCTENLRAKNILYPRAKGWLFNRFRLRVEIAAEDDAFAFKMRWC